MKRCKIDTYNCSDNCKECSYYDKDSTVEIRLYDHKSDKFLYKRVTETQLNNLDRIFGSSWRK